MDELDFEDAREVPLYKKGDKVHFCNNSTKYEEISAPKDDGTPRIIRIPVDIICGKIVDPDCVSNQCEMSAVVCSVAYVDPRTGSEEVVNIPQAFLRALH